MTWCFVLLPLQYPVKLWVLWDNRGMCRWVGVSDIEAESEGAPGCSVWRRGGFRGQHNCCLLLPEVGGGKRGHNQTLLRGNDHWLQKGKFWLHIWKDNIHNGGRSTVRGTWRSVGFWAAWFSVEGSPTLLVQEAGLGEIQRSLPT